MLLLPLPHFGFPCPRSNPPKYLYCQRCPCCSPWAAALFILPPLPLQALFQEGCGVPWISPKSRFLCLCSPRCFQTASAASSEPIPAPSLLWAVLSLTAEPALPQKGNFIGKEFVGKVAGIFWWIRACHAPGFAVNSLRWWTHLSFSALSPSRAIQALSHTRGSFRALKFLQLSPLFSGFFLLLSGSLSDELWMF